MLEVRQSTPPTSPTNLSALSGASSVDEVRRTSRRPDAATDAGAVKSFAPNNGRISSPALNAT